KSYVYSEAKKNTVISQNPAAGMEAREGEFLNLMVSKGERKEYVILPDFTGGNYVRVKDVILMLGLNIGTLKYEYEEDKEANEILVQDPVVGTRMEKGSEVNLKVNRFRNSNRRKVDKRKKIDFEYTLPDGIVEKELKVILIDDMGIREVHRKKYEPGSRTEFRIFGTGNMKALIYIDNLKVDEKEF
ncbi:MAG: PASTA domain-containing protein, partial [Candidatus Muiribacteriaceae bacterium]